MLQTTNVNNSINWSIISTIIGVVILWLIMSKNSNNEKLKMDNFKMTKEELVKHVKLAINPAFENWILFKNGTYIIIEDTAVEKEVEKQGLEKMLKFGPVDAGGPPGDFGTMDLNTTEGWLVSGHCYGMYTYVHPSELEKENPENYEIGLYGRSKRGVDGLNPEIICISSNGEVFIR